MRFALISSPTINIDVVRRYLPDNYVAALARDGAGEQMAVLIVGNDNAGWTLDDYVIPRLASGMIFATELVSVSEINERAVRE